MPYFAGLLSADELAAVVQQVKSFSTAFSRPGRPIDIPPSIPSSPESVARGKALFASQDCATCHGGDGGGKSFDDGSGHQVFARDLTASALSQSAIENDVEAGDALPEPDLIVERFCNRVAARGADAARGDAG
jgi:hypothetical protein